MAKAPEKYVGVNTVRKTMADGTVKEYNYDRKAPAGKRAIKGKKGTFEFKSSYRRGAAVTLNEVIAEYRAKAKAWEKLAERSRRLYEGAMLDIRATIGPMAIADIRRRHVLDMLEELPNNSRYNIAVTFGHLIFNYAITKEYTISNAFALIERQEIGEHERWPEERVDQVIDEMPERLKRPCMLGKYTGQRWSDVRKMLWTDYNAKERTIKVFQQKTGKKRSIHTLWIPCHPELADYLDSLDRKDCDFICFYDGHSTRKPENRKKYLEENGGQWPTGPHNNPFQNAMRIYLDKLGLEGYSFHGLRKTAAHRLAEAGCTSHEIMSITGHRTLAEVEKYTNAVNQKRNAKSAISKLVGSNHALDEDLDLTTLEGKKAMLEVLMKQISEQEQIASSVAA